jgi:hypothetical protein
MTPNQNEATNIMTVRNRWRTLAVLLAATCVAVVNAQAPAEQLDFPGMDPDRSLVNAAKSAEKAYRKGEFEDAMWLYRTRLAPAGDKFAQYMVGYMYADGEGVPRDPIMAAAWFLVAAERGHESLVEVSQKTLRALSASQRAEARDKAEALRAEVGDRAILEHLIYLDEASLREQTGSRSGTCSQTARVEMTIDGRAGQSVSMQRFCEVLNERIATRQAYLDNYVEYGDIDESVADSVK